MYTTTLICLLGILVFARKIKNNKKLSWTPDPDLVKVGLRILFVRKTSRTND